MFLIISQYLLNNKKIKKLQKMSKNVKKCDIIILVKSVTHKLEED